MEQFHLPRRDERTPPHQGEVGLAVPRIDVIASRLGRPATAGAFDVTPYSFEQGDRTALIRSPFGYLVRLHE